jgi:micrococcal nuclease
VRRTVLLFIAMVMVLIMTSGVALAASRIQILGLRCEAPGDDNKNLNGEYVLVNNISNKSAGLAGWKIYDRGRNHVYTFPAGFKLSPHRSVRVHAGKGKPKPGELYWGQGSSVWNNPASGDTATLRNRAAVVVSTKSC